jgi:hypothetical protein
VLVLIQFDVCEEMRLDLLQQSVNARTVVMPKIKHSVPAYLRYQRPPVVEPLETMVLEGGERIFSRNHRCADPADRAGVFVPGEAVGRRRERARQDVGFQVDPSELPRVRSSRSLMLQEKENQR